MGITIRGNGLKSNTGRRAPVNGVHMGGPIGECVRHSSGPIDVWYDCPSCYKEDRKMRAAANPNHVDNSKS